MLKTFQYRLYPTKEQETKLKATLEECRWLYNHFLAARKTAWEEEATSLRLFDQLGTLPSLKQERPSLAGVHSQVLQNVGVRIDLAFKAFFQRVKAGEKPGYPRFRGRERYDSFCYPQAPSGCKLTGDRLTLSGIGTVKVVLHRPLEGTPKTVCVRRSSTGKWYVTFSCEWEPTPLPQSAEQVGIDVGLASFATLSERVFDCPCCGLHLDRDLNAALNILRLGLEAVGLHGAGLALGSSRLYAGEQSHPFSVGSG